MSPKLKEELSDPRSKAYLGQIGCILDEMEESDAVALVAIILADRFKDHTAQQVQSIAKRLGPEFLRQWGHLVGA